MNTNDLRRGNCINQTNGSLIRVDSIGDCFINGFDKKNYDPIKLTKYNILKLGFNKDVNDCVFYIDDIYFCIDTGYFWIYRLDEHSFYLNIENPIKYVHEFQNFYYLIKGVELEISDKL